MTRLSTDVEQKELLVIHTQTKISFSMIGYFVLAAHFIIHVRGPGVVAFQHAKQANSYLSATEYQLTFTGGNSECNFKVKERGEPADRAWMIY